MALTSTLFTGLSGLNTNQTRMNVVGNNIANVNTVAFKASRALFKPQFYVTDSAGGPPSTDFGGQNPSQHGLGAVVGSIEKDFSAGSIEPTGKATDMAIDGEGFFVVRSTGTQRFTRDGAFALNGSHQLVTSSGAFVQGYAVDGNGNIVPGRLEDITIPLGAQIAAKATGRITMTGNLNASGSAATDATVITTQQLADAGGAALTTATLLTDVRSASTLGIPLFSTAPGADTLTLNARKGNGADALPTATFTVTATSTVQDLLNFYNQSLGIDTSVVPAPTPTPGAALSAAGDQIVITGNLGGGNALTLAPDAMKNDGTGSVPFTFTPDPAHQAAGESVRTILGAYDSLGTPVSIGLTAVLESANAGGGTTWRFFATSPDNLGGNLVLGNGTLEFNSTGTLVASTGTTIMLDRTGTGAAPTQPITLDFSGMAALSNSGTSNRASTMRESDQDGSAVGTLEAFSIGGDGTITGAYSNGLTRTIGQVALAKFNNPLGLNDEGANLYSAGSNSGLPVIGSPATLGMGSVRQNSLELSNVDLSAEFINLIVASTGFTAASRVITTSDRLLTELLNTSR